MARHFPYYTDHPDARAPGWGQLLRFSALSIPIYAATMPLAVYVPAILALSLIHI